MARRGKVKKDVPYIKIAYIGGGSRGWAHKLMSDLAGCPELRGEVRLYDINRPMALLNSRWGKRLVESPQARSHWTHPVPRTLKQALTGADFVVASIQPGPIEMMGSDLNIPARYGILHPVGDTVGPAGLIRALRTVPDYAVIAEAVERHCPEAWVINYTNPMTVCTRALCRVFPSIKAFGCCHEVFSTQRRMAELVQQYHGYTPTRRQIKLNCLGVNHFVWCTAAECNGIDLIDLYARHWRKPGMARRIGEAEVAKMDWFEHRGQVTWDLFRRYGTLPTGGERHLVEFLPLYLKDEKTIHSWGVKLTPYSYRITRYTELPKQYKKRLADPTPFRIEHSEEETVAQLLALLGMGDVRTNVNLPNMGQVEGLPRDAVVETNAYLTQNSVKPEFAGRLPAGVEALVARTVSNQEMIVQAALTRDRHLAFQAFLNDPLMTLTTDKAEKLFNEMLKATAAKLPGWKV